MFVELLIQGAFKTVNMDQVKWFEPCNQGVDTRLIMITCIFEGGHRVHEVISQTKYQDIKTLIGAVRYSR